MVQQVTVFKPEGVDSDECYETHEEAAKVEARAAKQPLVDSFLMHYQKEHDFSAKHMSSMRNLMDAWVVYEHETVPEWLGCKDHVLVAEADAS
jgi:hypothetical protein